MVHRKRTQLEKPLTDVELELMNVIWDLSEKTGECTVREVHGALSEERGLAYTTVATVMKILEQKGALVSRKGDRALTYAPRISRPEYESTSLRHLTEHVFRGDPSQMVMRLLNDSDLSSQELDSIRAILKSKLGSK